MITITITCIIPTGLSILSGKHPLGCFFHKVAVLGKKLSSLNKDQNACTALCVINSLNTHRQTLSQRRIITSLLLLYQYFYTRHSDRLFSLAPPTQTFRARTRTAVFTVANRPYYPPCSFDKKQVPPRQPLLENCYIIEQTFVGVLP